MADKPRHPKGIRFRKPKKNEDFDKLAKVINESWAADGIDAVRTADDFKRKFSNPLDFDPDKDCLVVESGSEAIGFNELTTEKKLGGEFRFWHYSHLLPTFRTGNLRKEMIAWNEARIREIAATHTGAGRQFIEIYANTKEENDWKELVAEEGYTPAWYLFEMVRSDLADAPEFPLPDGVEIRPVTKQNIRQVWNTARDALKDERNYTEEKWTNEAFEEELASPNHDSGLWQIAWHGDEVVGGVLNYIDQDENESFNRKWGHTERIFVTRPWRRKGVARALIARSLKVLRDRGMEKATLDVDTENPSGAVGVYETLGYVAEKQFTFYRKELRHA